MYYTWEKPPDRKLFRKLYTLSFMPALFISTYIFFGWSCPFPLAAMLHSPNSARYVRGLSPHGTQYGTYAWLHATFAQAHIHVFIPQPTSVSPLEIIWYIVAIYFNFQQAKWTTAMRICITTYTYAPHTQRNEWRPTSKARNNLPRSRCDDSVEPTKNKRPVSLGTRANYSAKKQILRWGTYNYRSSRKNWTDDL